MCDSGVSLGLFAAPAFFVIVEQDAMGGTVEIIELSRLQCPEEGDQPAQSQQQGYRDQIDQDIHDTFPNLTLPRLNRRAFSVTTRDDDDIAMAATSGVTEPATANGTVTRL